MGFILLKFIVQYQLISPIYDLHRDEFLHLDQANHLAWGYLSVPPLTSWLSYLIKVLGNSVFWIKFFPALFGALTIIVVWKTIEELKGNLFALTFGTACVTFSVLFRLNTLYQPNSLDVLSWTLIYYFIIRYINSEHNRWLYFIAVAFGLGFLNKYNISFLILGIIPAVIAVPERKVLFNRKFYYSVLIVFLIILPNLIWQYNNNFPVAFHFKELAETQLVNVSRWNFIRSQFLFFFGTFPVIGFGLYALLRDQAFRKYRLFFVSFFITLGIFLFLKAKDYYAIGIYPIYFAFGSVYVSSFLKNKVGIILKPFLITLPFVFFIPVYMLTFPNNSPQYFVDHPEKFRAIGMLTWEDGKEHQLPQDFADMLGWQELAQKVDHIYSKIPDPQNTLVLCDNYGQAGAINYYSKQGIRAVTFNADYLNWFDFKNEFRNLIRVKNSWESDIEMDETGPYFVQSIRSDSITNSYAREYGTTIFTFINAKIDINKRVKIEVEQEQRRHMLPVK